MNNELLRELISASGRVVREPRREDVHEAFYRMKQELFQHDDRLAQSKKRVARLEEQIRELTPLIDARRKLHDQHKATDHPRLQQIATEALLKIHELSRDLHEVERRRDAMQRLVDAYQKARDAFDDKKFKELEKIVAQIDGATARGDRGAYRF